MQPSHFGRIRVIYTLLKAGARFENIIIDAAKIKGYSW